MKKKIKQKFRNSISKNMDTIVVLILSIIFVIYVSNNPNSNIYATVTRKPTSIPNFFSSKSPVIEIANGSLATIHNVCSRIDICAIFFYAHWDAESRAAMHHIDQAAHLFNKEVTFVALNCWSPDSECAQKVHPNRYPKLVILMAQLQPITFKGPLITNGIVTFILRIMRPLCIIESNEHLLALRASYDNVILGYFDFTEKYFPDGYFQFYAASIRIVEYNSLSTSVFGLLLKRQEALRSENSLENNGDIVLLKTSSAASIHFQYSGKLKGSELIYFLRNEAAPRLVINIQPSLIKSKKLDAMLKRGPAFLMLIGSDALSESVEYYQGMLRALSVAYSTCDLSQSERLIATLYTINHKRLTALLPVWNDSCNAWNRAKQFILREYLEERANCRSQSDIFQTFYAPNITPDVSEIPSLLFINLKQSSKCQANPPNSCHLNSCCETFNKNAVDKRLIAEARQIFNRLIARLDVLLKSNWSQYVAGESGYSTDPGIDGGPMRLLNIMCHNNLTSFDIHPFLQLLSSTLSTIIVDNVWNSQLISSNVSKQGCLHNRSLTFHSIDTGLFPALPRNLGLDVQSTIPVQFAIIDWKNEVSHLFNESRTMENIGKFIHDFHHGRLAFHYRSSASIIPCHLNPFQHLERSCSIVPTSSHRSSSLCILSLSTQALGAKCTLQNLTLNNSLVLLFTSKWCGYCSNFINSFISLANYFRTITANKFTPPTFAKIDVTENDIPWQYQPERIPSILFIPAHRHMESSSLILNASSSIVTITRFIKTNLESQEEWRSHWPTRLSSCNQSCLDKSGKILNRHKNRLYIALSRAKRLLHQLGANLHLLNTQVLIISIATPWSWLNIQPVCQVDYCSIGDVCIERIRRQFERQSIQYSALQMKVRLLSRKLLSTNSLIDRIDSGVTITTMQDLVTLVHNNNTYTSY